MKATRRKFTSSFKAKVVIEALKERESLSELSKRFEPGRRAVHANMISKWKSEFVANSALAFDNVKDDSDEQDQDKLYAKIGRLEIENEFLKKSLGKLAR